MAQGRLQLDPIFALVPLTAQGRLQLDPFFALVRLVALGRLQLDPFFALVRIAALGRLQLDPFSALVRSAALGRLQLDPLARLTFQGRLQLDPFFALRIARPFLDYCASVLCLPHFNYFAHRCFVFPLFLVSLYPLDCFLSPPLSSRFSLASGGFIYIKFYDSSIFIIL